MIEYYCIKDIILKALARRMKWVIALFEFWRRHVLAPSKSKEVLGEVAPRPVDSQAQAADDAAMRELEEDSFHDADAAAMQELDRDSDDGDALILPGLDGPGEDAPSWESLDSPILEVSHSVIPPLGPMVNTVTPAPAPSLLPPAITSPVSARSRGNTAVVGGSVAPPPPRVTPSSLPAWPSGSLEASPGTRTTSDPALPSATLSTVMVHGRARIVPSLPSVAPRVNTTQSSRSASASHPEVPNPLVRAISESTSLQPGETVVIDGITYRVSPVTTIPGDTPASQPPIGSSSSHTDPPIIATPVPVGPPAPRPRPVRNRRTAAEIATEEDSVEPVVAKPTRRSTRNR